MRSFILTTIGLFLVLCTGIVPAHAQDVTNQRVSFGLYVDQDYFVNTLDLNEDRNYTMGGGIVISTPGLYKNPAAWPLKGLLSLFNKGDYFDPESLDPIYDPAHIFSPTLVIVGSGFTADSMRAAEPLFDDRPYASIFGYSMQFGRLDKEKLMFRSVSLTLGALGLNVSKEFQTWVHVNAFGGTDTKDPVIPKGWHNQISQGGEPTLLFHHRTRKLYMQKRIGQKDGWAFEASGTLDWFLGYYTMATAYPSVRLGRVLKYNWVHDQQALAAIDKDPVPLGGAGRGGEIYLYGSAKPILMGYNALLNGQFRSSVHTFSFSEINHVLFEWSYGIGFFIPFKKEHRGIRGNVGAAGRSSEYNSPRSRAHHWGSINLIYEI